MPWWAMTLAVYPDMNRHLRSGTERAGFWQGHGRSSRDHIGHQQVDAVGMILGKTEGFARCTGGQDGITMAIEYIHGHSKDHWLVFHQQAPCRISKALGLQQ